MWLRDEFDRLPRPGGGHTAERFEQLAGSVVGRCPRPRCSRATSMRRRSLPKQGWRHRAGSVRCGPAMDRPGRCASTGRSAEPLGMQAVLLRGRSSSTGPCDLPTTADDVTLALVDVRDVRVEPGESTWVGHGMRAADTRPWCSTPLRSSVMSVRRTGTCPGRASGTERSASRPAGSVVRSAWRTRCGRPSDDEPHALADLGAVEAELYAMRAVLTRAASEIDDAPGRHARRRSRVRWRFVPSSSAGAASCSTRRRRARPPAAGLRRGPQPTGQRPAGVPPPAPWPPGPRGARPAHPTERRGFPC